MTVDGRVYWLLRQQDLMEAIVYASLNKPSLKARRKIMEALIEQNRICLRDKKGTICNGRQIGGKHIDKFLATGYSVWKGIEKLPTSFPAGKITIHLNVGFKGLMRDEISSPLFLHKKRQTNKKICLAC